MLTGESLVEEYQGTHPGSKKLHERAVKILAADGATHVQRILDPFRPYITHAKGSRKWDVDGNEYIDYVMDNGTLILGADHLDPLQLHDSLANHLAHDQASHLRSLR